MGRKLFKNVNVFDGTGKKSFAGEVLVQGNQINKVAKGKDQIRAEDAEVIDAAGATLMPGLVEPHAHVTYTNCVMLWNIGEMPPEEHMVLALEHAKIMLDQGFTSLFSAAGTSKIRIEPVLRDTINAGKFPGPRIRAASPEINSTGGLGDERLLHLHRESVGLLADGVTEILRAARLCAREGCETLKINISGDQFQRNCGNEALAYGDEEVAALMWVAKERNLNVATHARGDRAIRMALKHDIPIIYHADFATEETLDLLEAKKKDIFMAPAAGIIYATAYEAQDWGFDEPTVEKWGLKNTLENAVRTNNELRKRGIRNMPGGDYGFAWAPVGSNARDIEHFVNLFGYSPTEALKAATAWGGELMNMNVGQVKAGYLADLLLVDGDPTQDVSILQDKENLIMIMKDGEYYKAPSARRLGQRRQAGKIAAAAE
ncbi:MAG: amidohydrolase family protein [Alphaproteobacteria bacterium]